MSNPKNAKKNTEIELPQSVGIIFSDVQRQYFPTEAQYITEKDAEQDARLIGEYLATLGIAVLSFTRERRAAPAPAPRPARDRDQPGRFGQGG